ncbi:MAG: hypothetical protein AB1728_13310 [Bacteroidota bacterium]
MNTSIPLRKKIIRHWESGEFDTVTEALADFQQKYPEITYFKYYNVIKRRVKTKYSYRADKGKSRKFSDDAKKKYEVDLYQFDDVEEFLEYQTGVIADEVNSATLSIEDRLKYTKDIVTIRTRLQNLKLEKHIGRADAMLISRIMRRLDPNLSNDDIIRIVKEEQAKLQAEENV